MSDWRDISTAPTNECAVLLGRPGYIPLTGYIGPHRKEWWIPGTGANIPFEPTHWQPLPDPPVTACQSPEASKQTVPHQLDRQVVDRPEAH